MENAKHHLRVPLACESILINGSLNTNSELASVLPDTQPSLWEENGSLWKPSSNYWEEWKVERFPCWEANLINDCSSLGSESSNTYFSRSKGLMTALVLVKSVNWRIFSQYALLADVSGGGSAIKNVLDGYNCDSLSWSKSFCLIFP